MKNWLASWYDCGVFLVPLVVAPLLKKLSGFAKSKYPYSRGILPSVMCVSVFVKLRKLGGPGPLGLLRHKQDGLFHTLMLRNATVPLISSVFTPSIQ